MTAVAIIPARGGSKRIPRKNIRLFHGKPIIAYSIIAAADSRLFDSVIVSTDDHEIASVAHRYGADIHMRPAHLADDHTGTQAVMQHTLKGIDVEQACCIYPCAPLLQPSDLIHGWQMLYRPGVVYAAPVGEWLRDPGQFYWGWAYAFKELVPLMAEHTVLVPIDPRRAVDINVPEDWALAEQRFDELHQEAA